MINDISKYKDIIDMPHHVSTKHKPMSIEMRAAQFSAFAALTGYDEAVKETGRLTENRIELNEEQEEIIRNKLIQIKKDLDKKTKIIITYFIPDIRKSGGEYVTATGVIKKIDEYKQILILEEQKEIPIHEIIEIDIID